MKTFLAVDIGASGGRHMLGWISENRLHMEEVYRFDNRMFYRDGHLYWDTEYLFEVCRHHYVISSFLEKMGAVRG